jgi:hypothetical protein
MKYTIVSELVGNPGDEYVAPEGVNVAALLEGGFIVEVSPDKPAKSRKVSTADAEE